ncbi:MAG: hypothetical protein ACJASR_000155 [Psychroserpens sp.]|jgi:hypothetical protein
MKNLDKNYKIITIPTQTISEITETEVYSFSGKGLLDCIIIKLDDTDMELSINIDGVNVVDKFTLKDLNSQYGLSNKLQYNLPLCSIEDKLFKYMPRSFQEFSSNLTIKLKHNRSSGKEIEVGYITFQNNSLT